MSRIPERGTVRQVVATFDNIEFLPGQSHDVLIVEFQFGERTLFGTVNRYVSPKAPEVGL